VSLFNLDGKHFSPTQNSNGGRVQSDTVFIFKQSGKDFTALYSGPNVSDGHIVGQMTAHDKADLIYHARASDGALEAGQATAQFEINEAGKITIAMNWQWLNGSQETGQSFYEEL